MICGILVSVVVIDGWPYVCDTKDTDIQHGQKTHTDTERGREREREEREET